MDTDNMNPADTAAVLRLVITGSSLGLNHCIMRGPVAVTTTAVPSPYSIRRVSSP